MRFPRPRFEILAALLALLALAAPAAAQGLQIPRPTGFVNDFANIIDPESEAAIDALIQEVRQKSGGAEIAVVTLPSLEGEPVSDVANRIAREWGVGARGEVGDQVRNTAALILVAPNDRRIRIETSEGAGTFLTAGEVGRIQDQYMVPAFQRGDFSTGIRQGTRAVAEAFAQNFGFQLTGQPLPQRQPTRQPSGGGRGGGGGFLLLLLFLAFFLFSRRGGGGGRGGRRRGWGGPVIIPFPMGGGWSGGGFGGGDGGGGFGGFGGGEGWGGGGADRGW